MNTDEAQAETLIELADRAGSVGSLRGLLSNPFFLFGIDLVLGALAYVAAWLIRVHVPFPLTQDLLPQERWDSVSHFWGVLIASQGFFLYIFGMYDDPRVLRYREVIGHIMTACMGQVVAITSIFYLTNGIFPRSVILVFGVLNLLLLSAWRAYVKSRLHEGKLRVLLAAEDLPSAEEIGREIGRNPWMGLEIIGAVTGRGDDREAESPRGSIKVLGGLERVAEVITSHSIDEVIFASRHSWKDQMLNSLSGLQLSRPLRIAIQPTVFDIAIGRLHHINIHDTPLIEVRRTPNEPLARLAKRSFDLVISTFFLFLLLPVMGVIALAIATTSPGRVFYRQERVGLGGRIFRLIKFRTMVNDAEEHSGERLAERDDPRVTRVGAVLRRFRLDEVPQFFNVLKGDMSFVGPRPERPGFVRHFSTTLPGYHERHKVKPGMTGLAQVRGYYDTAAENKLKYDLAYIYNYSLSLDLLILLETIKVILVRRGS